MPQISEKEIGYIDVDKQKVVYPFINKEFQLKPEEEIRLLVLKRLVLEYEYPLSEIDIEVSVKAGQTIIPKRADIIIFKDAKNKRPEENAHIIIEVKKKDRKDGVDQLETYINNTTAEFGLWFNGKDIVYLHRLRKPHEFREIPDIPKKGETLEDIGLYYKKDLKPATELKSVFETCHNYIYANEGLLKEKVFNEVLKLIFIKMADEKQISPKCQFRITEKELEELEDGKQNEFMNRILELFNQVKTRYSDVFDTPAEKISLKPLTIAFVVSQLQKYSLINTPADVKGDRKSVV
jgi:type I restriction enzyme M protein